MPTPPTSTTSATTPTGDARAASGSRLEFLDFLRGLAAFVVVIEHGTEVYSPGYRWFGSHVFNLGRFGVMVFFLISGFIIPVSLEKRGSVASFWRGRFFRLYPLFWLSLLGIVLLGTVLPHALPSSFHRHAGINLLGNLTMAEQLLGIPMAIGLYYTLSEELVWYWLCTAFFVAGVLRRSELLAWIGVAGTLLVGTLAPWILGRRVPMAAVGYLLSMLIGTVVYRYMTGSVSRRRLALLLLGALVVVIPGCWINYVRYFKADPGDRFTFVGSLLPWIGAYALFFAAFALRRRELGRPFLWLGGISYSVYLMHPLVLAVVRQWSSLALALPVLVVATLVISQLTYRFVEVPFQALGRSRRRRVATAPP